MEIYIDCTIEELQAKTANLQDIIQKGNIDKRYWLEALLPPNEEKNPYEDLPEEEKWAKMDEWYKFNRDYGRLRSKILEGILDALLKEAKDSYAYNELKPFFMNYLNNDTGGVRYKSALMLEKHELDAMVTSVLPLPENASEREVDNTFHILNRFAYEKELSLAAANQIADAMKIALMRNYEIYTPYFDIFNIVEKLAAQHAETFARVQEELVEVLTIERLDYRGYDSAIFMLKEAWPHLKPYWTAETIDTLIGNMIEVIDEEFSPGDAFVEDGVLRAIKVIGEGHAEAQNTIEQVEKELAEYYAQEEQEDE